MKRTLTISFCKEMNIIVVSVKTVICKYYTKTQGLRLHEGLSFNYYEAFEINKQRHFLKFFYSMICYHLKYYSI